MNLMFSILNRRLIYLIVFTAYYSLNSVAVAQTDKLSDQYLDFSAVESYFLLTDKLQRSVEPTEDNWQSYFKAPINSLMIYGAALDTVLFRSNLRNTYLNSGMLQLSFQPKEVMHHLKYKEHQQQLKEHMRFLKSSNVVDSIQKYLYPYFPERLRIMDNFPRQYYVFYGEEDATGGGGMVLNDLLLSYKIDTFRLGLLSAHEAFHSMVSTAFANLMVTPSSDGDLNIDLLYFLSNLTQEGIADLIDKPLLMLPQSPLKDKIESLFQDERVLAAMYISKLDSLLRNSEGNFTQSFQTLFQDFSKNGGHIPGKFMGEVIQEGGLLPELVSEIEDPILFIELYNKAVQYSKTRLPSFSKESLNYLNELKKKYLRK